jgi:hypothetical protein
MSIEFVLICNISKGQHVKLPVAISSSNVDGEQDRPCNEAAYKADDDGDLEESQEEVTI